MALPHAVAPSSISPPASFGIPIFRGIKFDEVDGDVLFVFAADEYRAAEIEDTFALHISIVASAIMGCEISIVMVLPQQLAHESDV
jgi:hypothetical protein